MKMINEKLKLITVFVLGVFIGTVITNALWLRIIN